MRILNSSLLSASVALLVAATASAQVNYAEDFEAGSANGWGGGSFYFSGSTTCGGAGGAIRDNIYTSAGGIQTSPMLGTSFGGAMTLSYDFKVADWSANTVGTAGWGSFVIEYGATSTGPWTAIPGSTVTDADDVQDGSTCFTKVVSWTPPAGDLYIRFNNTWVAGDYYFNLDNISCVETLSPCAGVPTPGDTTVAGTACDASSSLTLGLQNATTGSGVSYQWYSSADGVSYSAFGTDASTQVVTQAATTWYYCDVTCATGPSTGSSTPIMVDMFSAPSWPQGFDSTVNDDCWSQEAGTDPDLTPKWDAADGYGIGMGSFWFDFWASSTGAEASQVSPTFAALGAPATLYFDIAGRQYVSGSTMTQDEIHVEESNDGGATWTSVAIMINEPGGLANTVGGLNTEFVAPAADEWATRGFGLSAGTNRIRFRAVSDFGNNVFIDNVSIGVVPAAHHSAYGVGCADPFTLSSATPPVDDAVVTFDVTGAPEAQAGSGVYFGVVIISFSQVFPGLDLAIIGAEPGCNAYVGSLDVLEGYVSVGSDSASVVLDLPAGIPPGTILYEQAAAVVEATATNPAGLLTSNGLESMVNTF